MRRGSAVCIGTVALLLALVAAPAGRAESDPPSGAHASNAETPGSAADGPGNSENAPGHAADGPGNSENAPEHAADGPGNSENAPGHAADGPGNSENAPGHAASEPGSAPNAAVSDQGGSVGQQAGASASAGQDQVGNTQASVRVDEPGNGSPVGQENRAEADSQASAAADTPGSTTVAQDVQADAGATQSDVSNTVVTVRVGSPGDDGAVSQSNVAAATAETASDAVGGSDEAAHAAAGQDGATNTNVSIRVFSPGDDGPVSQLNGASAEAYTGIGPGAEAAASQDAVRNTSVSIRVGSPGAAGDVVQTNDATAEVSADGVAVAVTDDAVNTVVAVAVGASDLDRPGPAGLQVWVWQWTWQRDESQGLESLIGTDVTSWLWTWNDNGNGNGRRGTITSRAAGDGDRGGTWDWRWNWNRQGIPTWTWEWNWQGSLACGSCIWIWDWSWEWTGQPSEASAAQPPGPVDTDPARSGEHRTRRGRRDGDRGRRSDREPGRIRRRRPVRRPVGRRRTGRRGSRGRNAARNRVGQLGSRSPAQANIAESGAFASLDAKVTQIPPKLLVTSDSGAGDQWSGQQVDVAQAGHAGSSAAQRDATLTGAGAHRAVSDASTGGTAVVGQLVEQDGLADGGAFDQWVGQLTMVEQVLDANSIVAQAGTWGSRVGGGTAAATASAGGLALVEQGAGQVIERSAGTSEQTATQLVLVAQDASASATTTQKAGAAATPIASSGAVAANRAAVVQAASQAAIGSPDFDHQELVQESVVVQSATAVSTSNGGIAGSAVVVNCAVTHQGATQSIGAGPASARTGGDLTAFCLPPEPAPFSSEPAPTAPTSAVPTQSPRPPAAPAIDEEPALFRGGRGAAASPARTAHRAAGAAPFSPKPGRPELGSTATKLSAPHSTQARIDTRPGSPAGAGDAGREPPLPPAGDPPMWISALAAAASSAGSSGIAAILLAFALVPPLVRRVPEGSVVRRPTDVLAPVDVPV